MRSARGSARYHVPRDRSPVPAVLAGVVVVVTLVSAQLSLAGERAPSPGVAAGQQQQEAAPAGDAPDDPATTGAPVTTDASTTAAPDDLATSATVAPGPPAPDAAPGLPQPVEVTFEVGSDEPAGDVEALLGPLVQALLDDPAARVRVVGHAAPSNDPVLEEQLSLRRALTVLDVLADEGLPAGRADVVAAGSTQAGRSVSGTDRRVTVEVVPG